jgi:hypothetical protein
MAPRGGLEGRRLDEAAPVSRAQQLIGSHDHAHPTEVDPAVLVAEVLLSPEDEPRPVHRLRRRVSPGQQTVFGAL